MNKYLILFICIIILLILLGLYKIWKKSGKQKKVSEPKKNPDAISRLIVNCPVCRTPLIPGENLVSRVYRPMNVPDQFCTISGCPHCYPVCESGVTRSCPVCGKKIAQDGHLVARLFNYKGGKKHVTVTGCTNCCRNSPE